MTKTPFSWYTEFYQSEFLENFVHALLMGKWKNSVPNFNRCIILFSWFIGNLFQTLGNIFLIFWTFQTLLIRLPAFGSLKSSKTASDRDKTGKEPLERMRALLAWVSVIAEIESVPVLNVSGQGGCYLRNFWICNVMGTGPK